MQHLAGIQLATGLARNEVSVETVEHLLAALVSMGIDNVLVELNSPEVPIMDGSAAPFIYLIQEAGVKRLQTPRKYLKIVRPIAISRGDKRIALYPSDHFKVTYSISYDHPLLRHQSRTLRITEESFIEEIAPARTFTFLKDVEMLRQNGLALGGSLENAIVLGETGVLNNALRFEDEFVRHKILDAVGDLALVGYPVIGHLVAHRAGHALHTEFAAKILEETHAWRLVEAPVERAAPLPVAVKARRAAPRELRRPSSERPESRTREHERWLIRAWLFALRHDYPITDSVLRRRRRAAALEPVDPFADQIELQRVASRLRRAPGSRWRRRRASPGAERAAAARRARSRG